MNKKIFYVILFFIFASEKSQGSAWPEIQVQSTIGWRDADVSNALDSQSLSGQTYRFIVASPLLSPWVYLGVSYDQSKLYNHDASFSSLDSESSALIKTGMNLLPDWRLDLNYRHIVYGAMTFQSFDQEKTRQRIQGGRFGFSLEWTGMLGLGLVAGAEIASPYLKTAETSENSWNIHADQEIYMGGIARF